MPTSINLHLTLEQGRRKTFQRAQNMKINNSKYYLKLICHYQLTVLLLDDNGLDGQMSIKIGPVFK